MAKPVKAVPEGYHTLTPHLVIRDCERAIEFYKKAFGAEQRGEIAKGPSGKVMHAEIKIGDSVLMVVDEFPEMGSKSPQTIGGTAVSIHIYTDNADAAWKRATEAGASVLMPMADMFWGDRFGVVADPFGHHWSIAQHVKDMTPAEMEQAMKQAFAQPPPKK